MAEALSVAASGIAVAQVAAQVGKSIIKLKQLWDDLKDVPSTIGDLLDQIECLDPALWEAENTFSQSSLPPMFWDNSLASRSTAYCRKALSSLTELVDELALQINRPGKLRSKVASAKVVLKKEQLKSLEHRLQNAVRMLTLAQQSYLVALTRIQPDIIVQRFTEITTPLAAQALQNNAQLQRLGSVDAHRGRPPPQATKSADDDDPESHVLTLRRPRKGQDPGSSFRFRIRLPIWLSRTTWELQSSRSYGNWKLNLKCYSTVPEDSEVFWIARIGTPRDLQMLCARGLASPWDRDEYHGETLLHCALESLNEPMITYLLDIGLSPSEVDNYNFTPIENIKSWELFKKSTATRWPSIDELEILFDFPGISSDPEGKVCNCSISLRSKDLMKICQRYECPSHETTTLESRLEQLSDNGYPLEDPMVILDFLQPYWSQDLRALCTASVATLSLLQIIAMGLGSCAGELIQDWALLADMVISNTPNIHHVADLKGGNRYFLLDSQIPLTALATLIQVSLFKSWHSDISIRVSSRLGPWLSKIRSNGYDLEEYGRRESELLADKDLKLNRAVLVHRWHKPTRSLKFDKAQLRGYEYGPEPEDWKILLSYPEKSYAADFWRLVEDGPQLVPGAWVEDGDDEGYTWDQLEPKFWL